jgi:hypothetical protein
MSLTRTSSDLAKDLEQLAETTIGICVTVHRELGPGMSESVYARACRIELEASAISYEAEKAVPIRYRGRHPVHVAQAVSYLRATDLRIALVVNFNVPVLKQGIRRVVL